MKPYPLKPDTPPEVAGDSLHENGWTLAEVLEWYAGRDEWMAHSNSGEKVAISWRANEAGDIFFDAPADATLHRPYEYPPAEYGRDVLAAFILAGGATHPKHADLVEEMKEWCLAGEYASIIGPHPATYDHSSVVLALKRRILCLFSGPVEEGGVRIEKAGKPRYHFYTPELKPEDLLLSYAPTDGGCPPRGP